MKNMTARIEALQDEMIPIFQRSIVAAQDEMGRDFNKNEIAAYLVQGGRVVVKNILLSIKDSLTEDTENAENVFKALLLARIAAIYAKFSAANYANLKENRDAFLTALEEMIKPEPLESFIDDFMGFASHKEVVARLAAVHSLVVANEFNDETPIEEVFINEENFDKNNWESETD